MESAVFDVERFIKAIESRPPLWDSRSILYANKFKKEECWLEVCREMTDDFDYLSKEEKEDIEFQCQKRWRGIRSSLSREMQKRKNEKSGISAMRKCYVYFDQLQFLLPVLNDRSFASIMEEDSSEFQESLEDVLISNVRSESSSAWRNELEAATSRRRELEEQAGSSTETLSSSSKRLKKSQPVDMTDKLCSILTESLQQRTTVTEDSDRQFLLSMLSDLKAIPEEFKMDAKVELISVLRKYRYIMNPGSEMKRSPSI